MRLNKIFLVIAIFIVSTTFLPFQAVFGETISVSSDMKASMNDRFKIELPTAKNFKKLEKSQTVEGMPDSLYMVDPLHADNPVTESFMSKMQQISRFKRSSERADAETAAPEPFRSYVYKVRGTRVYLDKGNDCFKVNQKHQIYDGATGRPIGTVVIRNTDKTGSQASLIDGQTNSVTEGCYIDF